MQTRSFLYIDECLEGTLRLTRSQFEGPVNIGSEEMVTINTLAAVVADIAGKKIDIDHIPGPLGVRGRNSDNRLIKARLGWAPSEPLRTVGWRRPTRGSSSGWGRTSKARLLRVLRTTVAA